MGMDENQKTTHDVISNYMGSYLKASCLIWDQEKFYERVRDVFKHDITDGNLFKLIGPYKGKFDLANWRNVEYLKKQNGMKIKYLLNFANFNINPIWMLFGYGDKYIDNSLDIHNFMTNNEQQNEKISTEIVDMVEKIDNMSKEKLAIVDKSVLTDKIIDIILGADAASLLKALMLLQMVLLNDFDNPKKSTDNVDDPENKNDANE